MSLEFFDGFDHFSSVANIALKWDSSSANIGFSSTTVHFSGSPANSVTMASASALLSLTAAGVNTLGAVSTRIVGFAVFFNALPGSTTAILTTLDGASTQLDLRISATGQAVITRNGTVLATSTQTFSTGQWYYVELSVTIGSTTGAYALRVTTGGTVTAWLTASSVNTQATANATQNGIKFSAYSTGYDIDDVYILNTSGTINNTFLGECRVYTNLPNAEGTTEQWTPNSGTAHFSRVNETNPDGDTSYVSSSTAGQIDTYKFPTLSTTGTIAALQIDIEQRKDDTGARTTCVEYRDSGGTNHDGSVQFNPTTNFLINRQVFETDPATSAAWSTTGVNGAEFGIKCVA